MIKRIRDWWRFRQARKDEGWIESYTLSHTIQVHANAKSVQIWFQRGRRAFCWLELSDFPAIRESMDRAERYVREMREGPE